jgi:hypothetical protein
MPRTFLQAHAPQALVCMYCAAVLTAGYNPFDLLLQVSEVEARQVRQAAWVQACHGLQCLSSCLTGPAVLV